MQMPEADGSRQAFGRTANGRPGDLPRLQGVDRFEYRHEDGSNLNIFEVRSGHD